MDPVGSKGARQRNGARDPVKRIKLKQTHRIGGSAPPFWAREIRRRGSGRTAPCSIDLVRGLDCGSGVACALRAGDAAMSSPRRFAKRPRKQSGRPRRSEPARASLSGGQLVHHDRLVTPDIRNNRLSDPITVIDRVGPLTDIV